MFSALKKLTAKQDAIAVPPDTAGHAMSGSLQKKFSRGVNYNMKIIIKGDRNVGKSCLLRRLQGGGFIESYTPTEEIQVASIQWSFKATEDIVKVEVWDVVDRGKARPRHTGLKLTTIAVSQLPEQPALDAEFLDVYKGTHGVVLMMDITKSWTFDYVTRELPKVPSEIPVLILGNHCDMGHHRVISIEQATALCETYRENRPSEILYAESSMRNGFGLRLLHKFLGLPFLRLQKETLLALIERNKRDTEICEFEIAEFLKSDDADYNKFLNNLSNKRRQIAESNSRVPPPSLSQQQQQQFLSSSSSIATPSSLSHSASNSSISSQKTSTIPGLSSSSSSSTTPPQLELRPTKSIIVGGGQPIIIPGQVNITQQQLQQNKNGGNGGGGITLPSTLDIPQKDLVTALLQKSYDTKNSKHYNGGGNDSEHERKIVSLEEFCPDEGGLDRSFLDDIITTTTTTTTTTLSHDMTAQSNSDSDNDNMSGNPMVARFNDEPDNGNDDDDDDDDGNCGDTSNGMRNLKINTESSNVNNNNNNNVKQLRSNPLAKHVHHRKSNDLSLMMSRKFSISNEEINVLPSPVLATVASTTATTTTTTNYESSSSPLPYEENSDNNSPWLPENTIRRSPEGGEDVTLSSLSNNHNQDLNLVQQKQHQQQQQQQQQRQENNNDNDDEEDDDGNSSSYHHHHHRHSSEKKSTKHKKHKKDKKDKDENRDSEKKKKKKKKRSKETDLEEFLNGTMDTSSRVEEAYEAI